MGKVAHVEDIFDLLPLGFFSTEQEGLAVSDGEKMEERVEMRGGGEVQTGAEVSPAVLVGLVLPKLLLRRLSSPERQILKYFLQQGNNNIGGVGYLFAPGQADLIRHHKIGKRLRYLLEIHE